MERETLKNDKTHLHEENGDGVLATHLKAGVRLGDVKWIRLRRSLWWPAQVVDEKAVSDSVKPRKKNSDHVLVRLYGTYEYSYVDVLNSNSEFDDVLKRHKGSHKEIIQKALKQDFSVSHSGTSKTHSSKDNKEKATPTKRATGKQDGARKKIRPNSQSPDRTPQVSGGSARRFKVMQGLGLTAPSGSPFLRNGHTLSIVH